MGSVYIEGLVESLLRFEDEHTYLLLYRTPKWLGRFASFPKAQEILRTKGLRRMSELTWDRTARITLDALVQVVEGTRGEVEHRMNI